MKRDTNKALKSYGGAYTYIRIRNIDYNKKLEAKVETAEIKFLRNVAGYVKKDQT
jgi:hypothetical protein